MLKVDKIERGNREGSLLCSGEVLLDVDIGLDASMMQGPCN